MVLSSQRMMRRAGQLIGLVWALAISGIAAMGAEFKVVAYVPNWIDLAAFSPTIEYSKLTHINIAFENPTGDTGELSFKPHNVDLIVAAKARGVKVLISIGGGSASTNEAMRRRYFELIAPAKRPRFVAHLAEYVERHQFDGLDLDLEGPAINEDYGAFVQELAAALKTRGKVLTAALSQGYGGAKVPDDALQRLDFLNIMAYDGAGPWRPDRPGQHSSFESARASVSYWLSRGLPKSKAVLGVPFYGYGFGAAFRKRGYPYHEIVSAHPGSEQTDHVGSTIWYNGIPTISAKTQYVIDEGLGGVMIWSLDSDAKDPRSLLTAIDATLARSKP